MNNGKHYQIFQIFTIIIYNIISTIILYNSLNTFVINNISLKIIHRVHSQVTREDLEYL